MAPPGDGFKPPVASIGDADQTKGLKRREDAGGVSRNRSTPESEAIAPTLAPVDVALSRSRRAIRHVSSELKLAEGRSLRHIV